VAVIQASGTEIGNTPVLLINLTHIENLQGRHEDALHRGQEALAAAVDRGASLIAAAVVMEIAWSLAGQDQHKRAARLLGAGLGFHEDAGAKLQLTDQECQRCALRSCEDNSTQTRWQPLSMKAAT
jgi:hypothetical protein